MPQASGACTLFIDPVRAPALAGLRTGQGRVVGSEGDPEPIECREGAIAGTTTNAFCTGRTPNFSAPPDRFQVSGKSVRLGLSTEALGRCRGSHARTTSPAGPGKRPEKIRPPSVASIDVSRGQTLIAFVTFASVDRPICGHIVTEKEM